MSKITVRTIKKLKENNEKFSMLTAYDYSTAKYIDRAGIDIILIGDSLAMVA
ncbi:3-methyl-2-oxobutanoate hydroxymethyltransferase, partial [bacterium]|nr:3-methyl-2-oxobutanoate hydroxymethyltransferase [bacterium]